MKKLLYPIAAGTSALFLLTGSAFADSVSSNFENPPYVLGNINGQDGWSKTGAYDVMVVANTYGFTSFGGQTLRLSDAVTSGAFGDQTFSKSLINEAGETDALNAGFSGGIRQSHFEASFDFASVMSAVQPGMHMSVSPDRGDGARMSYLRFEDRTDGVHVFFDDVTDPTHAMNADTFNETDIATLDRSSPHKIKFVMDFVDGPDNDVVKIYIDGILKITGTSWEDYYRFDTESNPGLAQNNSRTVDSLLFRESGTADSADAGKGFLVDNLTLMSGQIPSTSTILVTPSNTEGWSTADTRPGGAVHFLSDSTAPEGIGALQLTTDNTTTAKAQYMHAANTLLSAVNELSYYTKQNSASFIGGDASYQLPILLDGTSGSFTTLVFEPYENGTVIPGSWQQWDVANGQFWSSRSFTSGTCSVIAGHGGAPFYTLAQLKSMCPNAVIVGFGVNIGSNNPSYDVETDLFDFNGTTYNFDPNPPTPSSKEACKGNGWMNLSDGNNPFKNQGDCVSFVATKGKNKAGN